MANLRLCSIPGCRKRVHSRDLCPKHYLDWRKSRSVKCSHPGCNTPSVTFGLCPTHYSRWQRLGTTELPIREYPTACTAPGCDKPVLKKGYCQSHYKRWWRYGNPLGGRKRFPTADVIRWIEQVALHHSTEECLLWPFAYMSNKYGTVRYNGKKYVASNLVCELAHGKPEQDDPEACHSCRNPPCVNPRHLRWGTRQDNVDDMLIHGSRRRGETHQTAKLTEADVREIRSLHGSMSNEKLGAIFGVTRGAITSVIRKKSWAWFD